MFKANNQPQLFSFENELWQKSNARRLIAQKKRGFTGNILLLSIGKQVLRLQRIEQQHAAIARRY